MQYCELHYEKWCAEREFEYVSKWDYFWMYKKEIDRCQNCNYEIHKDYYSLYYLTIENGNTRFSFHTPFPIGREFFPDPKEIIRVHHEEQEGLFRFGRGLFDEEKVIFKEKRILQYFEEALEKYRFVIESKPICPLH
ncbi:hypothetical protein V1499_14225 [Neobacillus sp. SCS-31]|uniref:hypothetical protein n=1 Tax=Neobacillus oceani TaxID=3115292 RepID=UPI003905E803